MKKWFSWALLVLAINWNHVFPDNAFRFQEKWQIQEPLVDPQDVLVWKDKVFVLDLAASRPVLVFSTNGTTLGMLGHLGRGPGEIQKGAELVGVFADRFLIVRDEKSRKFVFYDILHTLQFYQEHKYTFSILSCELAGNKIFTIGLIPEPYLGKILEVHLSSQNISLLESGFWGNFNEIPELQAAQKNALLKQAIFTHDLNGNVYLAIERSSLFISFSNDAKLRFKTLKPFDVAIPEFINPDKRFQFVAPPINQYPSIYFDISVDKNFLYAIYSGAKLQIINSADLQDMGKAWTTFYSSGKKLLVFDKESGDLKKTIELPVPAWKFEVTRDAFYILSKAPAIVLYKFLK